MLPIEMVFCTLFGLALGSFLNVCIVRLPRGQSIVHPGSRCFRCGEPLRWCDNLPLLGWLLLRGRSHCCHQAIPVRYPLVEAATACLSLACLLRFGLGVQGVAMAVLCWLLLGLAWVDLETYLLPDAFTLPGLVLGVVYHGLVGKPTGTAILRSLLTALALGGLLLVVGLIYRLVRGREGMGLGDVKLGALLGAWLGWKLAAVALFFAVVTGALVGIAWILARQAGSRQKAQAAHETLGEPLRLPFGAFLALSGIMTVFTGEWLLAWYLQFFR